MPFLYLQNGHYASEKSQWRLPNNEYVKHIVIFENRHLLGLVILLAIFDIVLF